MILAIDLGTKLGWALHDATSELTISGTEHLKVDRYSGGGMRYLRFKKWLSEVHAGMPVKEIVFEEVRRHSGNDAAHVYGGLLAVLTAFGEEHSIPYQGVPVGKIKKYWTGTGNANKDLMMLEARKRGHAPGDDNEADALAMLYGRIEGKF